VTEDGRSCLEFEYQDVHKHSIGCGHPRRTTALDTIEDTPIVTTHLCRFFEPSHDGDCLWTCCTSVVFRICNTFPACPSVSMCSRSVRRGECLYHLVSIIRSLGPAEDSDVHSSFSFGCGAGCMSGRSGGRAREEDGGDTNVMIDRLGKKVPRFYTQTDAEQRLRTWVTRKKVRMIGK
jgi:hypothetical protein